MTSDVSVLTWQKVIASHDWAVLKSQPELLERYIKDDARQHVAARLADERLSRQTLAEPDPESDDPLRISNAVLRLTVAVASRDEAATLASELAEAEDRGFRRAVAAMEDGMETVAPRLGPTAYARVALDRLLAEITSAWDHRPAADWRPMRTLPHDGGGLEFWFVTGDIGRSPRMRVPIRTQSAPILSEGIGAIQTEEFTAIAWRYSGRPPHREAA